MTGLSVAHRASLAQMLERVSDPVLARLSQAVAAMPGDRAIQLTAMLDQEILDRQRLAIVLAPLLPLFRPRLDGLESLSFPPGVLPRLWNAASAREPGLLAALDKGGPRGSIVADRICLAAAAAVRDRPDVIWPPEWGDAKDRARGLIELAGCCDLSSLTRRGLPSLKAWMGRPDEDQAAEFRLLMRDADSVAPDSARRLLDIFFAHMAEGAPVLRLVMLASGGAGREELVASSELSIFPERLFQLLERDVSDLAAFNPDGDDPHAIDTFKQRLEACAVLLTEIDVTLEPAPSGPWGKRAYEARQAVHRVLVRLIGRTEKAVEAALPMTDTRTVGRMTRRAPRLDAPLDTPSTMTAICLLKVLSAARGPAALFGCEAERQACVEALTERLTTYAEEIVEAVNAGEPEDQAHALKLAETAGRFLSLIDATRAAQTVRRRVTVAGGAARAPVPSPGTP